MFDGSDDCTVRSTKTITQQNRILQLSVKFFKLVFTMELLLQTHKETLDYFLYTFNVVKLFSFTSDITNDQTNSYTSIKHTKYDQHLLNEQLSFPFYMFLELTVVMFVVMCSVRLFICSPMFGRLFNLE